MRFARPLPNLFVWRTLQAGLLSFSVGLPTNSYGQISEPAAANPARVVYVDQYLLEDSAPDYRVSARSGPEPPGRRYADLELGYYAAGDDVLGEDLEQGARLRWGRETLNSGSFEFDATIANIDSTHRSRESSGTESLLTLRHSGLPLNATTMLATTVGHQRSVNSSVLHSGYRFRLPNSTLMGMRADLSTAGGEYRLFTGRTGTYQGVRLPRFDETGGQLTSMAFAGAPNDVVDIAAEFIDLGTDDDIRDHSSLLVGARLRRPDNSAEHAARMLTDDDGNRGIWTDSRHVLSATTTLRYGLFHFDPDLVWSDIAISNDQRGLYLRGERRNARLNLHVGYDYTDSGLSADAVAPYETHMLTFNGSLRMRRALHVGLTTNLSTRTYGSAGVGEQDISRLSLFATLTLGAGSLRTDLFFDDISSDVATNAAERHGLAASFDWSLPHGLRLTTELRLEDNRDRRGDTRRNELSTLFRYDLLDNLSAGLQASLFTTTGDAISDESGTSYSVNLSWRFLPDWSGSLVLHQNESEIDADDPFATALRAPAGVDTFWLTVRHRRDTGQAYASIGRRNAGLAGNGTVRGQVFYDENRDGVRQPSEQVAVGAVVLLDGRYEARTNQFGNYRFEPVPTGEHEIIVLTDEVPLPWGLEDATPRSVTVRFREQASQNFALSVIE